MRDIILIYHPKAGDTYFRFSLDRFIEVFSEKNYEIRIFRSREPGDMLRYLLECDLSLTQAVFVAGGTGTINEVVNGMMRRGSKIPIGVIPAGTDNEFAKSLGFGDDLEENLLALSEMNTMAVDIAKANESYFVNICSAGTIARISDVSNDMKNILGRWAYYIKGIGVISKIRKMNLRLEVDGTNYEGSYAVVMILNDRIRRQEREISREILSDGKYDLVAAKIGGIANMARALVKIVKKEPIQEKDILYVRGSHFRISLDEREGDIEIPTEIDGEKGPGFPIEIQVYQEALNFFIKP